MKEKIKFFILVICTMISTNQVLAMENLRIEVGKILLDFSQPFLLNILSWKFDSQRSLLIEAEAVQKESQVDLGNFFLEKESDDCSDVKNFFQTINECLKSKEYSQIQDLSTSKRNKKCLRFIKKKIFQDLKALQQAKSKILPNPVLCYLYFKHLLSKKRNKSEHDLDDLKQLMCIFIYMLNIDLATGLIDQSEELDKVDHFWRQALCQLLRDFWEKYSSIGLSLVCKNKIKKMLLNSRFPVGHQSEWCFQISFLEQNLKFSNLMIGSAVYCQTDCKQDFLQYSKNLKSMFINSFLSKYTYLDELF